MTISEKSTPHTDTSGTYFVADWLVEPKLNKISDKSQTHIVEPRLIEVLTYLAKRPNQVVSRKELIDALWQGQVSDGAVNRVIAKLRKSLGDDTVAPKYIKTVAKQGYQLIALVTFPSVKTVNKRSKVLVILAILMVIIFVSYKYYPDESINYTEKTLQPLTSLKGNESGASFSPDGKWLIYTHQKNLLSPLQLYIKSTDSAQVIKLTDNNLNISAASFSSTSKSIVYFEKNLTSCQLVLMNLDNQMQPLTTTTLTKCDASEHFSTLVWSADDTKVIYTDRKSSQHPYLIQQLTLDTGRIQNISQVPDSFYGDYAIAISSNGEKLAFLRAKYWDNSELYIMDTTSLAISKVWQFDFLVWSVSFLDDETVIYSDGKSPGNLYQLRIEQQKVDHLYSSTGFIFNPKKAQNNILYTQVNFEVDLWHKNLVNKVIKDKLITKTNSSFIDEKPVISDNSASIAFLSNRQGELALWIDNGERLFPLKSIDSSKRLDSYLWLADNKRMIIETGDNKILLVNTDTDKASLIETINDVAVHPSISNDSRWLYYSSDKNGDWQIWRQLIAEKSMPELITPKGGYNGKESYDGKELIFTKYQDLGLWKMHLGSKQESLIIEGLPRRTQFKICEDSLFFANKENNMKKVWQYFFDSKKKVLIFESPISEGMQFDVNQSCSKLLYSVWQGESDIMLLKIK
ncbi:MAG: PD40 domain-containing protein [Colwellia sp.]|nr:PD40 domain-containing protein [Colwellia sp.]